jgi:hypothetical protein
MTFRPSRQFIKAEGYTMIMNEISNRFPKTTRATLLAAAVIGTVALTTGNPVNAGEKPPVPMVNSKAGFVTWHQGFEHNTEGWYDASTAGPLGWCGAIESVNSRGRDGGAVPAPSAGRAYATVENGLCNEFWSLMGVPGGAPYAPGPDLALYSDAWPESGYVTELDIWLDPAWSGNYLGNFGFPGSGSSPYAVIQYAATIFPTDYKAGDFHTGPHYFAEVEAVPGEEALTVAQARIEEAGWYTFRFVFTDVAGDVWVDFELAERSGPTLAVVENIAPVDLMGPFKFPFTDELLTSEYGSGHVWFFDIAFGLQLPIDEHRVRRGR